MRTQGERIDKLERTVFGNGDPGMDENVRNLVRDVADIKKQVDRIAANTGPTYSEMEALKRAIFDKLDLDALGNPRQYDADNHPSRRFTDDKKLPPIVVDILKAIVIFVCGGTFLWLITEVFPRIFSTTMSG